MDKTENIFESYRERLELLLALKKVTHDASPVETTLELNDTETDRGAFEKRLKSHLDARKPADLLADMQPAAEFAPLRDKLPAANFTDAELDAFMLCAALHALPGFHQTCDMVLGDFYPNKHERRFPEDVLYAYHGDSARACFESHAPLLQKGLLIRGEQNPLDPMRDTIHANVPGLELLSGKKTHTPGMKFYASGFQAPHPYQDYMLADTPAQLPAIGIDETTGSIFHFHGPAGSGKRRLARHLCSTSERALLEIQLRRFSREPQAMQWLRGLIRFSADMGYGLLLEGTDLILEGEHVNLRDLLNEELLRPGIIAFMISSKRLEFPADMETLITVEFKPPNRMTRERIWSEIIADYRVADDVSVSELARMFHIPGDAIRRALREAAGLAGSAGVVKRNDLMRICRSKSTSRLSELAFLVEPKFGWEDLILPSSNAHLVREIEADIRADERIFEEWHMDRVATAAKGHNILFTGIPGTGKTMAASIIAAELGLELYKVDLSRVSSKYVGEVEKNLAALFDEAEKANAALFFDEADSLFGKRGDNQSAQGHYVNQQIGYLLQRLEKFKGIAFMATNLHENMDNAFERRFNYVVRFTFPDTMERIRIWERAFSRETPLADDVDFQLLGREFEATGAHIKAIALRAARRAAADDTRARKEVTRFDIVYGTVREFDKVMPGWGQGYKDEFKDDIARVRAILAPEEADAARAP